VFYSISNCQKGLQGISFGNLLIKQVATDLAQEIPTLKNFVTLSPVPRFAAWLKNIRDTESFGALSPDEIEKLEALEDVDWVQENDARDCLEEPLKHLAARYLLSAKSAQNHALDPVARFHLGNGARLERINWLGDLSQPGIDRSRQCGHRQGLGQPRHAFDQHMATDEQRRQHAIDNFIVSDNGLLNFALDRDELFPKFLGGLLDRWINFCCHNQLPTPSRRYATGLSSCYRCYNEFLVFS